MRWGLFSDGLRVYAWCMKRNTSTAHVVGAAGARFALLAAVLLFSFAATNRSEAQPAPNNGPREVNPRWHAIVHATAIPEPGERIEDATIVLRDGVIVSVRAGAAPPAGARVWDYSGLTVYAGLIDAHVPVEAPAPDAKKVGTHWNSKVTPQRSALDGNGVSAELRDSLVKLGFTAAAMAPESGVFRGTSALVLLTDDESGSVSDGGAVVSPIVHHVIGFDAGSWNNPEYPNSQMGAIALIRQTLLDADWHARSIDVYSRNGAAHEPVAPSDALDALGPNDGHSFPLLFDTSDELEVLRAGKIAREFNRPFAILGSGTEFRRLDAIAHDKAAVIAPLNFPKTPDVKTISGAESVSLRELMTWEQAPTNPRRLDQAGVKVALTTDKIEKRKDFFDNLRKAITHGLTSDRALAMLTTNPAEILGAEEKLGRIAPGYIANLVVVDGDLFEKKSEIRDVWVAGERTEISEGPKSEITGTWDFTFGMGAEHDGAMIVVVGDDGKIKISTEATAERESVKARDVKLRENRLSYLVDMPEENGTVLATAIVEGDRMLGSVVTLNGGTMNWTGTRRAENKEEAGDEEEAGKEEKTPEVPEKLPTPFGAYGLLESAKARDLVVQNATIWTSGPDGIIEDGVFVVSDGKISYVGGADGAPSVGAGATVIDAEGKHVTPGLIDCHSHTGISKGVNEGSQAVTSEVRIFDVINPDAIGWYRELAGGLTCVNQLHGSANPIGGQNSVVKIRWGVDHPDDMRFDGAIAGIKFALGENVKQSNWGDKYTTRYPQTRMGVESIIRDRFIAAKDYQQELSRYESLATPERDRTMPPRRDLELEALAEILDSERLIHCHSYRQDEILMLCRVAQDFGFQIGTFQHVLEGYKIAEAIKEAAIGGSTFSDWWAYKFEVYDAIPENGAIMTEVGVAVSFNSDSDELARRMNLEAAKAVKYGGIEPAEALKFVTLNPAKQLKIDDHVGSLEAGKDADFVIWSLSPLDTFTRCEATYVDGVEMFSLDHDTELRKIANEDRQRIIQKVLAMDKPDKSMLAKGDSEENTADDDAAKPTRVTLIERMQIEALERHYLELMRSGINVEAARAGDCGCGLGAFMIIH